jgi:tetratricopeptide (TPR) repeat protein
LREVVSVLDAKQRTSHDAETVTALSSARNELANNLLNQGRREEALAISRQRWRDLQASGDPGKYAASALSMLALAELANRLPTQALQHARLGVERAHATLPGGDREAFALLTLARAQLTVGNPAEAATSARNAVALFSAALGAEHRDTGLAHGVLGRALLASGQRPEARKELDAAIAILSAHAAWLPELAELRTLR